MKKYSVAMVRERLSEALDAAEQGTPVFIERRGITYELTVRTSAGRKKKTAKPQIDVVDPSILKSGNWTWDWTDGALEFRSRRS
jgi:hypothetical protein